MSAEARKEFIRLAHKAQAIADSLASWKTKYESIFSDEISGAIRKTKIPIIYYYPDSTYEDDVRTFVRAVMDKAEDLEKLEE